MKNKLVEIALKRLDKKIGHKEEDSDLEKLLKVRTKVLESELKSLEDIEEMTYVLSKVNDEVEKMDNKKTIEPSEILKVTASIVTVLLVLHYEQSNVITSKLFQKLKI